mmetsp:Transcript_6330/g.24424  ORF Transcript_6330/g.24424 Transcript_6330/m.24424 type:complete len:291 (-) Transcript_6330:4803-5675(-)
MFVAPALETASPHPPGLARTTTPVRGFHAAKAPWHEPTAAMPPAPTATAVTACDDRPEWRLPIRSGSPRRRTVRDFEPGLELVRGDRSRRSDHGDAATTSVGRSHQSPRRLPDKFQSPSRRNSSSAASGSRSESEPARYSSKPSSTSIAPSRGLGASSASSSSSMSSLSSFPPFGPGRRSPFNLTVKLFFFLFFESNVSNKENVDASRNGEAPPIPAVASARAHHGASFSASDPRSPGCRWGRGWGADWGWGAHSDASPVPAPTRLDARRIRSIHASCDTPTPAPVLRAR